MSALWSLAALACMAALCAAAPIDSNAATLSPVDSNHAKGEAKSHTAQHNAMPSRPIKDSNHAQVKAKQVKAKQVKAKYDTAEHNAMGNAVKIRRANGQEYALSSASITTAGGQQLSYADALALCGDFYGAEPISDAFVDPNIEAAKEHATRIFLGGMWSCLDADTRPPTRFNSGSDTADAVSTIFTGPPSPCLSYANLAKKNFDHFVALQHVSLAQQRGGGAWEAYSAGHRAACNLARDGEAQATKALVMNGCASHFLSDMFAPGHQTNPRRAVAAHAVLRSWDFKNYYSKWMHDEGNQAGMNFTNARGDRWRGYGDDCDFTPLNTRNREIQIETLGHSAQLVYNVAQDPHNAATHAACIADTEVQRLIPNATKLQDPVAVHAEGDISPMFISRDGQTLLRRGLGCPIMAVNPPSGFCDTQVFNWVGVDRGADPCLGWFGVNSFYTGGEIPVIRASDPCGSIYEAPGKHNRPAEHLDKVIHPDYGYRNVGYTRPAGTSANHHHHEWE